MLSDWKPTTRIQMLCTGAGATDFVIYTLQDMQIFRIDRNESFIQEMTSKLTDFFNLYFRQAVLDKYLACDYFEDIQCNCVKYNLELPCCVNRHNPVLNSRVAVGADMNN